MDSKRGAHILLADATGDPASAIGTVLGEHGFQLTRAADAPAALSVLAGDTPHQFELVLLNLQEAGGGALPLLAHLRQDRSSAELPVIIITPANSQLTEALLQAGANDVMSTPLEIPVLIRRVQAQIDLASARDRVSELEAQHDWATRMEALGYLNSGVAHDIKGQLAQMQMGFDALQACDAEQMQDTGAIVYPIIKGAIEKADAMLDGLIRFTSAPAPAEGPIDLHQLLESEVAQLGASIREADVSVETEFDRSIPEALADTLTLRQVVRALVRNAIESMPAGGVIKVRTSIGTPEDLEPGGGQVLTITIEDSGCGIADENLPKIFKAFFTTKAPGRGIGLGLTIAKNLIRLNGGRLLIENRPQGGGAIATVYLTAAATSPVSA